MDCSTEASGSQNSVPAGISSAAEAAALSPHAILDEGHIALLKGMLLPKGHSLFEELTVIFRSEAPGRLTRLREAVVSRDAENVARLAHAMVGSLATLGARRMQHAAKELELLAATSDWEKITLFHERFLIYWEQLEAAFDQHIKGDCK